MKVSELMQAMSDAGAPMEAILIAVRALEERDGALEKKRAVERDRKRRQRAKEQDTDGTVTGLSRDTDGTVTDETSLSPAPSSFPQTPNQHPHPHTHPDTNTPARKAGRFPDSFPCPEWGEPEVWADLLRNRKTKNLANTATAHRNFVRAVEAMSEPEWPPGRLLEAIVALGWGGAHDPRESKSNGTQRSQAVRSSDRSSSDRRSTLARVIDEGLDFLN